MSNSQVTLSQFFSFHEKEISQDRWAVVEASERMSSLKEKVSEEAKGIRWPMAFKEISTKVGDLLNINLADIMVGAWKKSREILEYLHREKYSPDETLLVPLAEHTIQSEHHPYIEILIQDKPVGKIEFSINLALTLKGMVLKIKGGKIMEILTGSCQGKGAIKCENFVILERKTESFALPGSINLGEGIGIAS
jgi:hypothetical protein